MDSEMERRRELVRAQATSTGKTLEQAAAEAARKQQEEQGQ